RPSLRHRPHRDRNRDRARGCECRGVSGAERELVMGITIDYGIDLGTTNSAIARQDGSTTRLLKGREGNVLLPSAVFVDAGGAVAVGAAARGGASQHPADTATEFKRLMGTDEMRSFPSSGKRMSPEELSAEVLRELGRWVVAEGGQAPNAAVIT